MSHLKVDYSLQDKI